MRRTARTVLTVFLAVWCLTFYGCGGKRAEYTEQSNSIKTYKDIPGITNEEISAIENLKEENGRFSYAFLYKEDAFIKTDGAYKIFSEQLCTLMSKLFGAEFIPQSYGSWDSLIDALYNGTVDFASYAFPAFEDETGLLYTTTPISDKPLKVFMSHEYFRNIDEGQINILRLGFLNGSKMGFLDGTVIERIISENYPDISFESVYTPDFETAAQMLSDGTMDMFVADAAAYLEFYDHDAIVSYDFFKMMHTPLSITATNPDLAPVISAFNKYLVAGGSYAVQELKHQSDKEYVKQKLYLTFTEEEREFVNEHRNQNIKIDIGLQHDAYPVSFYNKNDKEYQGIALDILAEVTELTGIVFEPKTTTSSTPLYEISTLLLEGEIQMMTQLLYTDSGKDDYIWSENPYYTSSYALLSKNELPDLEAHQIYYVKVGTVNKSAYEEVFKTWFPQHPDTVVFDTVEDGFDALEKGEIDLLMLSDSMLLTITQFREHSGYKVNYDMGIPLEAYFGYNRYETVLCSIVDKASEYIDIEKFSDTWVNRTFDYSRKIAKIQADFLLVILLSSFIVIAGITFMFLKNKRLSKTLLERSAKLSTILSTIPDIVFSMDNELVYTGCNHSFESLCGYKEEEIIGKSDADIFGSDKGKKEMIALFAKTNRKCLETKETIKIEEWVDFKDGTKKYMETIKTPLLQNNEVVGIIGISRDITGHRDAMDEVLEANRIKNTFLANMSHEIRTPMNAIIGTTEILLGGELTDKQREYAYDINVSSHALLAIINDILDLSKIENGKLEINPVDYNFHVLLDNIKSMFIFLAENKGIGFKYESKGIIPKFIYGDDIRLRQVLTSICGNAIKFTRKGYIKLVVIIEEKNIVFKVEDTGVGIQKEELSKLFDAFYQADIKKRRSSGTGLGLAISKTIVEMMDGVIKVDSVYGKGTVFHISIPLIPGNENKVDYKREKSNKSFIAPATRILIVDDNEVNLKVAQGLLNLYQIKAETALSGAEAIEMIKKSRYDIVFMDHMMPEMDGIETVSEIRKLGPEQEDLPIVALTANAILGAKEMFLMNGFDGFVAKPINTNELTSVMLQFIPPEKVMEATVNNKNNEESSAGFLDVMKSISEINTDIGLNRVSGVLKLYYDTLKSFYKKLLNECIKMEECLNGGDLHDFSIKVHGMKSVLATIGAMNLSQSAYELETASKNYELSYCKEYAPGFLERLRALNESLSDVFKKDGETEVKIEGSNKLLNEKITEALRAAKNFDNTLGSEIIEELLKFDYGDEIHALLQKAGDAFSDFDCDRAAEHLSMIENPTQ